MAPLGFTKEVANKGRSKKLVVANKEISLYAWLMISPFWVNFFTDKICGLSVKGEGGTPNSFTFFFLQKNVLSSILRLPNASFKRSG